MITTTFETSFVNIFDIQTDRAQILLSNTQRLFVTYTNAMAITPRRHTRTIRDTNDSTHLRFSLFQSALSDSDPLYNKNHYTGDSDA